jgi:hypothetical protein
MFFGRRRILLSLASRIPQWVLFSAESTPLQERFSLVTRKDSVSVDGDLK